MKIILTGATGFVGSEVLTQALIDSEIDQVTVLTRRPLKITNPKLKEVLLKDFLDYSSVAEDLKDHDAIVWALGISQTEVGKEEYIKITYDYTMAAAKSLFAVNPHMRFCFVSGDGADQEEKAMTLFGKIKGRAEKDLLKLSPDVFNFRPAYIKASRKETKRPFINNVFIPIAFIADQFTDKFSIETIPLAKCLLGVAKHGFHQSLLDNSTIRKWS